jgi:hypothetical protein
VDRVGFLAGQEDKMVTDHGAVPFAFGSRDVRDPGT